MWKLNGEIYHVPSLLGKSRECLTTGMACHTPARGQYFINSVTLYAYDATDVIDDVNFATVLESFVIISSL